MINYDLKPTAANGRKKKAWVQHLDENVKPWQADLKPGDYFRRVLPPHIDLVGKIIRDKGEYMKPEVYSRNYRLCELGLYDDYDDEDGPSYEHVAEITEKITKEEFDRTLRNLSESGEMIVLERLARQGNLTEADTRRLEELGS